MSDWLVAFDSPIYPLWDINETEHLLLNAYIFRKKFEQQKTVKNFRDGSVIGKSREY